jgi:SLA1 homology domain 1, SHD1
MFQHPRINRRTLLPGTAFVLVTLAAVITTAQDERRIRVWTSGDGKFTVEAALIRAEGDAVVLKRKDGVEVTVMLSNLSAKDREFAARAAPIKAGERLPPAVEQILQAIDSQRDAEIKRLIARRDEIKVVLRRGRDQLKTKFGMESQELLKTVNGRIAQLENGECVVPRLSPKELAAGQLGALDDNLIFSHVLTRGPMEMTVAPLFIRPRFTDLVDGMDRLIVSQVSAECVLVIRGVPTAGLKAGEPREHTSPTNRAMQRVFEVLEQEIQMGGGKAFVLRPFELDEVNVWLTKHARPTIKL